VLRNLPASAEGWPGLSDVRVSHERPSRRAGEVTVQPAGRPSSSCNASIAHQLADGKLDESPIEAAEGFDAFEGMLEK